MDEHAAANLSSDQQFGWEECMRRSTEHILTSHVGSLPRPDALIAANRARETGELIAEGEYQRILGAAVMEGVRRQHKIGIDVPCDGEFGKAMGQRLNY